MVEFEKASSAILSPNMKCLVMGLGNWRNRHSWCLHFLKTIKKVKFLEYGS